MILLALESAGDACSVAVWDADRPEPGACLAERCLAAGSSGRADRLVELIAAALADAGLDSRDLDVIAVDHGPGSFTGVRSAVAATRGLALAAGLPAIAVSGLDALAGRAARSSRGSIVLAALDARRGQVYAQPFTSAAAPLAGPRVLDPAAALDDLPTGPVHVIGSGARLVAAALPAARGLTHEDATPSACDVARCAAARLEAGEAPLVGFEIEPLYLRAPDARLPRSAAVSAGGAAVGG